MANVPRHGYDDTGTYTSLAFLPDTGQPAVSYLHGDALGFSWFDGSQWNDVIVDDEGGHHTSLLILPSGRPAISYYVDTNRDLKYAEFVGDNLADPNDWAKTLVDEGAFTGGGTSLALVAGQPAISYCGDANLKYAWFDGSAWQTCVVDAAAVVDAYTSLAVRASGQPVISYFDDANDDLKYAWHDGGAMCANWHTGAVDTAGEVGLWNSLAILPSGQPAISYFDESLDSLKYAFAIAGDLNADGVLNLFDIDAFTVALASAGNAVPFDAYYAAFPGGYPWLADVNADGSVNNFDIDPFVDLLTSD